MTNLPEHAIDHALTLVGAVRDYDADRVGELLAVDVLSLQETVVALAAMVDDSRTVVQLLAWADDLELLPSLEAPEAALVREWRDRLTEAECKHWHLQDYHGVTGDWRVEYGEKEYAKRRKQRNRRVRALQTMCLPCNSRKGART